MKHIKSVLGIALVMSVITTSEAQVTVNVDPGASWLGFMNVFEIPQNGGGYVFGSGWGTADLRASFAGPVLTLACNTIGDPDPFWYVPSGGPGAIGNKTMDANMYVEPPGSLPGVNLTFQGMVLANTLVGQVNQLGNGWTAVAFIKDFAPDYSSNVSVTAPLSPGAFSISLATINDPARHVQYGFEVIGPDVWAGDPLTFYDIQITSIPEPTASILLLGGFACLLARRNRES